MFTKRFLLGFALLVSLIPLSACGKTTTTLAYDYDDFDFIDAYGDVFNRFDETYLVYIYSTSCPNCAAIKSTVIDFAATYTGHRIYFFDITGIEDPTGKQTFLDIMGQTTLSFPALIVVVGNGFDRAQTSKYLYLGKVKIPMILNDIENGSFVIE
jgi:thiol-disulfide isomerase/thioredoxin